MGARRRTTPTMGRLWAWAIPVMAAALAVLVVVVVRGGSGSDGDEARPVTTPEPGLAHVHGLGRDPADGALYAATHTGLFRISDDGSAARVGDRYQDTMGFTVVGPGRFIGSGHPDLRDRELWRPGMKPLLGLVESTDAGESWTPRSLLGEVDFHGLVAAHGSIYGWDATSGAFMVSSDGERWERRTTMPIASFAVSEDGSRVIASLGNGLVESEDGGRSWRLLDQVPKLVVLSWERRAGAWGAQGDGTVWASPDGRTWERRGRLPGKPEALLASPDRLHAATPAGIYESADGGREWTERYRFDAQ